ncbi:MAG TPA: cobalt-precorrin-4/precorrin-4 C(11)-methyltransferase [Methanomassiliicoccales archaeon]|jgi:precorrin-4/cobalt-precorrin-4 C11-methyltransferase
MAIVQFVGAGPGDPDLITVKGMDLVMRADVLIYAGSLVNPVIVDRSPAEIKLDSWGMSLEETTRAIVDGLSKGKRVVRLHSGDPSIFGSIVEQIFDLKAMGIDVEIVPGVSSMFAAAAALKTQLTLKGVSDTLIVTRPAGATLESDKIAELSGRGESLVIFLGTDKMEDIMDKVTCPKDTPAAVVYHASWPDQKVVKGTVGDICSKAREAGIEKTALILIGGIVDPEQRYKNSVLYS